MNGRLRYWGGGAVPAYVPFPVALEAFNRFRAWVRVRSAWGNDLTALRTLPGADPADLFVRGGLVHYVDAHRYRCGRRSGHGYSALSGSPRGWLMVWSRRVESCWVTWDVAGLVDLLLQSGEPAGPWADDAVHLDHFQHQGVPTLRCQSVPVLGS